MEAYLDTLDLARLERRRRREDFPRCPSPHDEYLEVDDVDHVWNGVIE